MKSLRDSEDRVFHAREIIMQTSNEERIILLEQEVKALISLFDIHIPSVIYE